MTNLGDPYIRARFHAALEPLTQPMASAVRVRSAAWRPARTLVSLVAVAASAALLAVAFGFHPGQSNSGAAGSGAGSSGAAGTGPAMPRSGTAASSPVPVDLSGARAAAVAFFDPSQPQCWKDPVLQPGGEGLHGIWPADTFARCPLTSRLGSYLRDHEGLYMDGSLLTEYRAPTAQPGAPSSPPAPYGLHVSHFTVTVGAPIATPTGATVKVRASDGTVSYENDANLVQTSGGWLIDDILIYGRNMPYPVGHAPHPGMVYFMPDADGFAVSLYNPCTTPTAASPQTSGC